MKNLTKFGGIISLAVVLSVYPIFVISYTWFHVLSSELEGGRHGPLEVCRLVQWFLIL